MLKNLVYSFSLWCVRGLRGLLRLKGRNQFPHGLHINGGKFLTCVPGILILQNFWKFFSHRLNLNEKTRLFFISSAFSLEAYGSTVLKKLMRQVI
jgi:hypothetical protein